MLYWNTQTLDWRAGKTSFMLTLLACLFRWLYLADVILRWFAGMESRECKLSNNTWHDHTLQLRRWLWLYCSVSKRTEAWASLCFRVINEKRHTIWREPIRYSLFVAHREKMTEERWEMNMPRENWCVHWQIRRVILLFGNTTLWFCVPRSWQWGKTQEAT